MLVDIETPSCSMLVVAVGSRALGGTYAPCQGRQGPNSGIKAQTGENTISAEVPHGPHRLKITQTSPVPVTSPQGAVCTSQTPRLRLMPLGTELSHRCLAGHPARGPRGVFVPLTLTSSGNSSPTRAMIRDVFPTWARKVREDVGTSSAEPERAAGSGRPQSHPRDPGRLGPRAKGTSVSLSCGRPRGGDR